MCLILWAIRVFQTAKTAMETTGIVQAIAAILYVTLVDSVWAGLLFLSVTELTMASGVARRMEWSTRAFATLRLLVAKLQLAYMQSDEDNTADKTISEKSSGSGVWPSPLLDPKTGNLSRELTAITPTQLSESPTSSPRENSSDEQKENPFQDALSSEKKTFDAYSMIATL